MSAEQVTKEQALEALVASSKHWHRVTSDDKSTIQQVRSAEDGLRGCVELMARLRGEKQIAPGQVLLTIHRHPAIGGGPKDHGRQG